MVANVATKHEGESAWRNPWVWLLAGIMGTAIIVNSILITLAFMSPPGLVVDDYYERGKNYLYHQAQVKEDEARLGWQMQLDLPPAPHMTVQDSYLFRALDAAGQPIEGAQVEFAAFRPAENGHDMVMPMREISQGFYSATPTFKKPGNWDLLITIRKGEDQLDLAKRIFVKD